jgi:hypothetical protein
MDVLYKAKDVIAQFEDEDRAPALRITAVSSMLGKIDKWIEDKSLWALLTTDGQLDAEGMDLRATQIELRGKCHACEEVLKIARASKDGDESYEPSLFSAAQELCQLHSVKIPQAVLSVIAKRIPNRLVLNGDFVAWAESLKCDKVSDDASAVNPNPVPLGSLDQDIRTPVQTDLVYAGISSVLWNKEGTDALRGLLEALGIGKTPIVKCEEMLDDLKLIHVCLDADTDDAWSARESKQFKGSSKLLRQFANLPLGLHLLSQIDACILVVLKLIANKI